MAGSQVTGNGQPFLRGELLIDFFQRFGGVLGTALQSLLCLSYIPWQDYGLKLWEGGREEGGERERETERERQTCSAHVLFHRKSATQKSELFCYGILVEKFALHVNHPCFTQRKQPVLSKLLISASGVEVNHWHIQATPGFSINYLAKLFYYK